MYETLVGTITEEDINEAAQAIGFSRENAKRCERLVMREIPATDPYLQYLMACTAVNHGLENPDDLYASWGGADPSYTDSHMADAAYEPDDHAILAVYLALKNLNTLAWDCHGFTLENALWCTTSDMAGYMGNVQDSNEAIYISHAFSWYYNYCVWPQDAMWYPQTQLSPNWDNN